MSFTTNEASQDEVRMLNTRSQTEDPQPGRRSIATWSLRRCYALIFSGELGPGDEVDVSQLTERLNVSRSPLREALSQLETDGLVYSSPVNGRRYVATFGRQDVHEIYQIRLALETPAIRIAAERVTEPDIEGLRALLVEMRTPDQDAIGTGFDFEADMAFHERIVRISGQMRMLRTLEPIWLQTRAMLTQLNAQGLFPAARPLDEIIEEHVPIVEALARRDAEAGHAALTRHLERAQGEADVLYPEREEPAEKTG